MEINFHTATPIFKVSTLEESVRYYEDKLGFTLDWSEPENIASVSRGDAHIMLAQGDQGAGKAWIYVGVSDALALYHEYKINEVIIRHEPTNYYWGLEFQVNDLDGNVIRFASENNHEIELKDEWLDMNGKIWQKNDESKWIIIN